MNQTGNKISWKMKCTGQAAGEMTGVTVFGGDTFETTMKMQSQGQAQMAMDMQVKARRLGECP
jgi:hypothetical protein